MGLVVDNDTGGFASGRQFRFNFPLVIAGADIVIKFTSPVDFVLRKQSFSCIEGGYEFNAYRLGTEGGVFTSAPFYSNNFQSDAPAYTPQVTIESGGTFTPSGPSVELVQIKTASATAQQSSVGGAAEGQRGLPAGTYYLVFSELSGAGATGIYNLIFDERF